MQLANGIKCYPIIKKKNIYLRIYSANLDNVVIICQNRSSSLQFLIMTQFFANHSDAV